MIFRKFRGALPLPGLGHAMLLSSVFFLFSLTIALKQNVFNDKAYAWVCETANNVKQCYNCIYSQSDASGAVTCFRGRTPDPNVTFNNGCQYDDSVGPIELSCPGSSSTQAVPGAECGKSNPDNPGTCQASGQCPYNFQPNGQQTCGQGLVCCELPATAKTGTPTPSVTPTQCLGTNGSVIGSGICTASCNNITLTEKPAHAACNGNTPICCSTDANIFAASLTAYSSVAQGFLASKVLAAKAIFLTDFVSYDPQTKTFSNPKFPTINLPAGSYEIFLHVNGYLVKQLTNANGNLFTIAPRQTTIPVEPVTLEAGDLAPEFEGDNVIDVQDYNEVVGCVGLSSTTSPTSTCLDPKSADVNHDGLIDQKDVDYIQARYGDKGDTFTIQQTVTGTQPNPTKIPTYTCVTDPDCASSQKSLQLCPLKCTLQ